MAFQIGRITVIYSCLGAPAEESGFAAGYDLDKEEFVEMSSDTTFSGFPMRWLFRSEGSRLFIHALVRLRKNLVLPPDTTSIKKNSSKCQAIPPSVDFPCDGFSDRKDHGYLFMPWCACGRIWFCRRIRPR